MRTIKEKIRKTLISDYNSFVDNFLDNAKDMDAETSNFIDENYIDLLANK